MDLGIKGHVAVVTGGARGIGAAIATSLAGEGCKVALWDRDVQAARELAATLEGSGAEVLAVEVDVGRREAVREAVEHTLRRFGTIHILINNAGFSQDASITKMTDEQWDSVISICLKGVFLCTQEVVPTLIRQRYGRIINIASRGHLGGEPNKSNYAAAKGGVVSMTKALAVELGPHDVTVNAVAPGFVMTDRLQSLPHFAELEARALALQPIKRRGLPEDQANGVLFLAAKASSYITGEVLYITGGRYG